MENQNTVEERKLDNTEPMDTSEAVPTLSARTVNDGIDLMENPKTQIGNFFSIM